MDSVGIDKSIVFAMSTIADCSIEMAKEEPEKEKESANTGKYLMELMNIFVNSGKDD